MDLIVPLRLVTTTLTPPLPGQDRAELGLRRTWGRSIWVSERFIAWSKQQWLLQVTDEICFIILGHTQYVAYLPPEFERLAFVNEIIRRRTFGHASCRISSSPLPGN